MMRILQIIPGNIKNGAVVYSNFINNEILGLQSMGVDIEIFFFISRMSVSGFLKAKKNLEKLIESYKPDLIHVHTGSTTTFLVAVAKKRDIPWVITFGGSELLGNHKNGIKWWLRDLISVFLSKTSAVMCNGIICVSKNLQKALPRKSSKKSIILPRGVDITIFIPLDKTKAREELNINTNEIIVLFSLNRTSAQVKNKNLADKVVTLFETKYKIQINLISLIGYSEKEIVLLLNAADALLVTSLHEGSPNIVKEAMACNLPVVSVNCGDVNERLKNVKNSFVHTYDAELLCDSLYKVIKSGIRSNGREVLLNQKLDRQSISLEILKLYKAIIDKQNVF